MRLLKMDSARRAKRDLQLHLLKSAINYMSPRLLGSLDVKKPETFQGQILARAFESVQRVMEAEARVGLREDANFTNMVEASKRALLFLAETDNYYMRWLGLILQELTKEVEKFRESFSYEDALKAGGRPIPLSREVFEAHRSELLDLALSGYLTRLEDLSPEEMAKLKGGWYNITFKDPGGP
jgi:hypothetical protein